MLQSVLVALCLITQPLNKPSHDVLDSLLSTIGWTKDSLGFHPKPSWGRFPDMNRLPYLLPFFPDLYGNPLSVYEFSRGIMASIKQYLTTDYRSKNSNSVYKTVYAIGIDKWLTGFRSYGSNILKNDTGITSEILKHALERLWRLKGGQPPGPTFGGSYGEVSQPWEDFYESVDSVLPEPVLRAVGVLIENIADALYWHGIALRNVPTDVVLRVTQIHDLQTTQPDGSVYYPEIDGAFAQTDWHSFLYGAMKCVESIEDFIKFTDTISVSREFNLSVDTPFGEIILSGKGNDTLEVNRPLLVIDFGGDDVYHGELASAYPPDIPVSISVDLQGNDIYESSNDVSQGAGILGIGILWDADGNDHYRAENISQGSSQLGFGLLVDEAGTDTFSATEVAQGTGFLGIGMLFDLKGNDSFSIMGNGQGDGEYGGIGILIDYKGNDSYYSEPWSEVFDRGDYHSKFKVNASNAQGFGGGRRGDGSDGHSWAGGMGVLVDLEGNDKYTSGNWSLGTGYWFGIGLLLDENGDDVYKSCYFTQASGAHFSIGALFDENGNDKHELFETMGAALGFGWDFTVAIFFNRNGNDYYRSKIISVGVAQIRSQAFFFDFSGNDIYEILNPDNTLGMATPHKYYKKYNPALPYFYKTHSIAIFLDLGGNDQYLVKSDNKQLPFKNDTLWFQPEVSDTMRGNNNFGIGLDTNGGFIKEFQINP